MSTEVTVVSPNPERRPLCWGAVLAGLVAATALQFLFMILGTGLGFAAYDPITNDEPLASLGKGALLIQGISAVISLWFGGWVAGRLTPLSARGTGGHHGFLVWCSSMIAGALLIVLGAGWTVSGVAKLAGTGLSGVGEAVGGGVADVVKSATTRAADTIESYVDEAVAGNNNRPAERTAQTIRAQREISFALTRLFRDNQTDTADVRTAAIRALEENTGLSTQEATRLVDGWTEDFRELQAELKVLKEEAEAKARVKAEQAADALAAFGILSFFAFLIGAISAICGGRHGARCALRKEAEAVMG